MALTHVSEATGPQRLLCGALVGAALGCLPWGLDVAARVLLGWSAGVAIYLLLAWWLAVRFDARRTRERARALDQPNVLLLVVMLCAVGASMSAIAEMLLQVKDLAGPQRSVHVTLAVVALGCSWLLIHTMYAYHYAHRYYQKDASTEDDAGGPGLEFPGSREPDYFDFLYYSYVIGMTSQVSDVQVTSREMRRITLVHGVLSFAFNLLVLALGVNVVASIMQ